MRVFCTPQLDPFPLAMASDMGLPGHYSEHVPIQYYVQIHRLSIVLSFGRVRLKQGSHPGNPRLDIWPQHLALASGLSPILALFGCVRMQPKVAILLSHSLA